MMGAGKLRHVPCKCRRFHGVLKSGHFARCIFATLRQESLCPTFLMTVTDALILFAVATGAGALNSVAGGGSFLTFPTLLFLGVPAVPANATNKVALWPGAVAGASAYHRELRVMGTQLIPLSIVSIAGGYVGALLLLVTPNDAFRALVPWLLLVATVVFAFGGPLLAWLRRHEVVANDHRHQRAHRIWGYVVQVVIAVYGGFFGGGIGILILAALTLTGMENLNEMNGLKNLLTTCINGVATVTFAVSDIVLWPEAIVMLVGAILGGYAGAAIARKVNPKFVRAFVIIAGVILTIYFFVER